jgi:hypothetical protein
MFIENYVPLLVIKKLYEVLYHHFSTSIQNMPLGRCKKILWGWN